jgi:hypothetical protein
VVGANLQENINVLVVLEDMLEFHNVVMIEGFVNFDLSDKFLLCSGAIERAFGDYLGR